MATERANNRINETKLLTMRFPVPIVDRIIQDIEESGEFRSLTDWMLTATRFFLREREKERLGGGGPVTFKPSLKKIGCF